MQKLAAIFLFIFFCWAGNTVVAQSKPDSVAKKIKLTRQQRDSARLIRTYDSTGKLIKVFNPRLPTIHSAMVPGWGQIDNKKYWKLPLVYGALGVTTYVFFDNIKTYKLLKNAYIYMTDKDTGNDTLIDKRFKNFSPSDIKTYRNSFRQNVDYSVLFFIVFWGLNVVDATVDAQLKGFDVNDNLSLKIAPGYSPMANTSGVSLVLDIHSKKLRAAR